MPWTTLEDHAEVLAVHAAYMGFGKILYFGGDEFDADRNRRHQVDATRLFDCGSFAVERMPSPPFDTFCAGHAFVRSGNEVKFLVAGGTEKHPTGAGHHHDHFRGLRDAAIFNSPHFSTPSGAWYWTKAEHMGQGLPLASPLPDGTPVDPNRTGGRWYPTCLTLANGDVIAFAGHPGSHDSLHDNRIPEVFSPDPQPLGKWRRLAPYTNGAALQYYGNHVMPLYPRVHLLPSSDILCSSPVGRQTLVFRPDVGSNGGTYTMVCIFPPGILENYSYPNSAFHWSSVLLPLGLRQRPGSPGQWDPLPTRVMICGGTSPRPHLLDLTNWPASPANWQKTGPRAISKARMNSNATILPTGEILVTGGIDISELEMTRRSPILDSRGTKEPELYDPYVNKWTVLNQPGEIAEVPRNYHSVALLMPDGRVWTAGSSIDSQGGAAKRNLDIEIYEPWYHGDPGRPYITDAPSLAYAGQTIKIKSTFANEIERVVIVRCGSCTHAFDSDQRLVELKFRHAGGDELQVEMPADNFIFPSGPYLIFTIRKKTGTLGLPSSGTDIHVVPEREPGHDREPKR